MGKKIAVYRVNDNRNVVIDIQDGKIFRMKSVEDLNPLIGRDQSITDYRGCIAIAGLIEIHRHAVFTGGRTIDFCSGALNDDDIKAACSRLEREGVTTIYPTLDGNWRKQKDIFIPYIRDPNCIIRGLLIEAGYINPEMAGALFVTNDSVDKVIDELLELNEEVKAAGGKLIVDVSPELPGAIEVISQLAFNGVIVGIAHTKAGEFCIKEAVNAGAAFLEHWGNRMGLPRNIRELGAVFSGLMCPCLYKCVIADFVHVHPVFVKLLYEVAYDKMILISDNAGVDIDKEGFYKILGGQEAEYREGVVRLISNGAIAGSAFGLIDILRMLVLKFGFDFNKVVDTMTSHPADLLNLNKGRMAVGRDADIVILSLDDFSVQATIVNGRIHRYEEATVIPQRASFQHPIPTYA